jgi:hypothetical protein
VPLSYYTGILGNWILVNFYCYEIMMFLNLNQKINDKLTMWVNF